MKFSPYGSSIPLVFVGYVSSRNSKGSFPRSPKWGRQTSEGWVKSAGFSIFKREYLENGGR